MNVSDPVADQLRQVQQAATSIIASVTEHRQAIAAKEAELKHAQTAPGPPDEVIAERHRYIDEMARARGPQQHGGAELVRVFGAAPGHSAAGDRRGPDTPWTWADECSTNGDAMKQREAEAIAAYTYAAGPPKAARPAVIAKLEAELAEMKRAEEQLIDDAADVGVTIAHRPEVTERRDRERSQRERAERTAEAERRAAAAAAEANDWPQPRTAPSTYLHGLRN